MHFAPARMALLATLAFVAACASRDIALSPNDQGLTFPAFYAQLKEDVAKEGLDPALLDASYGGKPPYPMGAVTKAEGAQPELNRTFADYTGPMLSKARVDRAQAMMTRYARELAKAENDTGIPAGVMVALWGIETSFGAAQGDHPVIPALVTLAWQSPRHAYFQKEVFSALKVVARTGTEPHRLTGSWAGAMGQCQFMPSNYLAYGRDGNGDGKIDIWHTPADVFASTGTFLKANGWKRGKPWRIELQQPVTNALHLNVRGLSAPHTLAEWKKRGLKTPPKGFADKDIFRVYQPQPDGPVFLTTPNFETILKWNKSSFFAYSALALADTLQPAPRP